MGGHLFTSGKWWYNPILIRIDRAHPEHGQNDEKTERNYYYGILWKLWIGNC